MYGYQSGLGRTQLGVIYGYNPYGQVPYGGGYGSPMGPGGILVPSKKAAVVAEGCTLEPAHALGSGLRVCADFRNETVVAAGDAEVDQTKSQAPLPPTSAPVVAG